MLSDRTVRKHTAMFHVSFADEQWEEISALSRVFLCAAEMQDFVQEWNVVQQQVARNRVLGYNLLAQAKFLTVEVHHVEI